MSDIFINIFYYFANALPLIIGTLSVLFLDKKNHKLAEIVYYIMLVLSVVPLLLGLMSFFMLAGFNPGGSFGELFPLVGGSIAVTVQFVLLLIFLKKPKVRKIIGLTLMITPLLLSFLTLLIADIFGITLITD